MSVDFAQLAALRAVFLGEAEARADDYWSSEPLLVAYHRFFGGRIQSKWRSVLADVARRGFEGAEEVVDWGSGTGVAALAYLETFGSGTKRVLLHDRSFLALRYAAGAVRAAAPSLDVETAPAPPSFRDRVVLLSHVVNELDGESKAELLEKLGDARAVLWVEPGTPASSAALVAVRERWRGTFRIVAPCTHRDRCGMLAPENARHWCHFFAEPDPMVFRDAEWRKFSQTLHVDLRSLPTSYLALDRGHAQTAPAPGRVIGRPRVSTGYATVLTSRATGVTDDKRLKRDDPQRWKAFKTPGFAEYL